MSEALKQKNFYERLNVPRNATKKQITRAFREIASVYHPDAGMYGEEGGDLGKAHLDIFVLITEAYNTLNDEEKRAAYDRKLGPAPEGSAAASSSSSGSSSKKSKSKGGWENVNRFDEEDRRRAEELREQFQVRESAFEDGGEIRSSLDLGNLGQRTSILRSEIYKGGASDLDRDELHAMVEEEEEEEEVVEEEPPKHRYQEYYSVEDESEDDYETVSVSEKLRDLFDLRRPIIPLIGGLLFGIIFALLVMFLIF